MDEKVQDVDDSSWQTLLAAFMKSDAVQQMSESIRKFFSHSFGRFSVNPIQRERFLEVSQACITDRGEGVAIDRVSSYINWKYLYINDGTAGSSCLLARQFLNLCLRGQLEMAKYQTDSWRTAMTATGADNPSVLGFLTEQVLLGEFALAGFPTLGTGFNSLKLEHSGGPFLLSLGK